jgi:hypothetical protein
MSRRHLTVTAAVAGLAVALAALGASARPAAAGLLPATRVPAGAITGLTAAAYRQAATEGDPAPTSAQVVLTTEAKALAMADNATTIAGAARVQVYMVVMKGHFRPVGIPVPPKFVPPSGPDLVMLFSASTMQLMVMGVGGPSVHTPTVTAAMLGHLGSVTALSEPAR